MAVQPGFIILHNLLALSIGKTKKIDHLGAKFFRMPRHEQSIPTLDITTTAVMAIAFETLNNLQWDIFFVADEVIIAQTPKSWKKNGQQITCTVSFNQLTIASEMISGELVDLTNINKRNTGLFAETFETNKAKATETFIHDNIVALRAVAAKTAQYMEQQLQEKEAEDKIMKPEGSNLFVTYAIVALNVLVFILMVVNGAGLMTPNGLVHIRWGSDYAPLTLSGDWWRLFTCTFIHFGFIHLAMNMYCLFTVGMYLEPVLGKAKYTNAYICTGLLSSLASVWWHTDPVNSAGASGAVFGMYGLFLALLTSNLIPKSVRQRLLQSIVIFIVYNLAFGMQGGVDNAAHVGGLVSGFVIGYVYIFGMKAENNGGRKLQWVLPAVIIATAGIIVGYLQLNKVSPQDRAEILTSVRDAGYKDYNKFNDVLLRFDELNGQLTKLLSDSTLSDENLIQRIDKDGISATQEAERILTKAESYDLSAQSHAKAKKLLGYIQLKNKELKIIKDIAQSQNTAPLLNELNGIRADAVQAYEEALHE